MLPGERARGNRHELEYRKFYTNMKKTFSLKVQMIGRSYPEILWMSFSGYIQNPPERFPVLSTVGNHLQQGVELDDLQMSLPTPMIFD